VKQTLSMGSRAAGPGAHGGVAGRLRAGMLPGCWGEPLSESLTAGNCAPLRCATGLPRSPAEKRAFARQLTQD
jgi:hypothetical protein